MSNNLKFTKLDEGQQPPAGGTKKDNQNRQYYPYFPSDSLVKAVNLAISLERPLLLEGDPGCGKTELAKALVYQLTMNNPAVNDKGEEAWWPFFIWNVKSYSRARDGLYTFDAVGRLRDAQMVGISQSLGLADAGPINATTTPAEGQSVATTESTENIDREPTLWEKVQDPSRYIKYGPLGNALKETKQRAVLLIDEIDKADGEFGNDLLLELDQFYFEISETGERIDRPPSPPIVIITSNCEKPLPKAFLRRCLYYKIPFPDKVQLCTIMKSRLQAKEEQREIFDLAIATFQEEQGAIERFEKVRDAMVKSPMSRPPSTSEFIDFLRALLDAAGRGEDVQDIADNLEKLENSIILGTILKTEEDQTLYRKLRQKEKQEKK